MSKVSVNSIQIMKNKNKKITALTAYDYSTAKILDIAGIDMILIGDSLAMVALGYETTHQVGMDEMLVFTKAVANGAKRPMVVADMPFMSYHSDIKTAVENAGDFIRAGAKAVKIEGGTKYIVEVVKHCVDVGIPVLGHLGFTPQFLHTIGGYNIQGKSVENTVKILEQAQELQEAGAFGIVLEMVPEEASKYITENLKIPTIGIGAGRFCSGQILVLDDLLGKYTDFTPKFAKKYANLADITKTAVTAYVKEVEENSFPSIEHVFNLDEQEKIRLENINNLKN